MLLDDVDGPLREIISLSLTNLHRFTQIMAMQPGSRPGPGSSACSVVSIQAGPFCYLSYFTLDFPDAESSLFADLVVGRVHKAFNDGDALCLGEPALIICTDVRWLIH